MEISAEERRHQVQGSCHVLIIQVLNGHAQNILKDQIQSDYVSEGHITLHYITLSAFQTPPTPKVDQYCINNNMLYEIQPTRPAQSGTTKKENQLCSGANCSSTHNIISSMAPHEFNVVTEDNGWV